MVHPVYMGDIYGFLLYMGSFYIWENGKNSLARLHLVMIVLGFIAWYVC